MNKTKKILGSLIVVTLAVAMTACGKKAELEPAEVVTATPTPTVTPKPTATPAPTATPVPDIANKTIYAADNVNVRASAASDGEIVGSLTVGEGVTALENAKDGWIRIQLDDADGYVKEEYMSETAPEGAQSTETPADTSADTGQAGTAAGTAADTSASTANTDASGIPYGPSSNWSAHDTGNVDDQGAKIYADTGRVVDISGNTITIVSDIDGETIVYAQEGLNTNNTSVGESATIFYYDTGSIIEVQ